ncbi:recombinase family protein [Aquisediminimonas profunda]|uniref:recombinase family protein n=1 Tax=Aquisediminimonas profunda TaxID=1550733 RepID=UPI001C63AFE4|nr:recombinase family protein [Aquisediminimonas profunda]
MQPKTLRCAIYTRKSTEEGLEQEFNSLDAQREACAAYITSQRHEGWTPTAHTYEDGGYSGGSMQRPAIQQLMADVAAGKVDVIVVYKVDRLTRSLADFAKIVEVLDARGASFVSVTQAFNTTTSMGRLTLNVLLSFAQFEREVTGERIRDKVAASRAKGMWMGGTIPLGYDPVERKLIVNQTEAALVRHIYNRYLALGSGQALVDELASNGYQTKLRTLTDGSTIGGRTFTRGMLFYVLSNRLYIGEVSHKGIAHPGEHEPIVDRQIWDDVQKLIEANRVARKTASRAEQPSLLVELVVDGLGRRMSPSHAVKGTLRYRYYITHQSEIGENDPAPWRVPSHDLEKVVVSRLCVWLNDRSAIGQLKNGGSARETEELIASAANQAKRLLSSNPSDLRKMLPDFLNKVRVERDRVRIDAKASGLLESDDRCIELETRATKVRIGKETKMVIAADPDQPVRVTDTKLVTLIGEALKVQERLLSGTPLVHLATEQKTSTARLSKLARIAWLAPEVIEAIIEGRQPSALSKQKLMTLVDLPMEWSAQRRLLGFAA